MTRHFPRPAGLAVVKPERGDCAEERNGEQEAERRRGRSDLAWSLEAPCERARAAGAPEGGVFPHGLGRAPAAFLQPRASVWPAALVGHLSTRILCSLR